MAKPSRKTTVAIYDAIEQNADSGLTFVYDRIIRYGNRWVVLYSVKGDTIKEYYVSVVLEYKKKFGVVKHTLISTGGV